ncbi:MAG: hypothetical protein WC269_03050, partial [Candidatus Gracilibacteria bacterium]
MPINDSILAKKLLEKGVIQEKTLNAMVKKAKTEKISLEDLLFKQETVPDDKLGAIVAEIYGIPFIKLTEKIIPEPLLRIVPYALASSQYLIPFEHTGAKIKLAINDPE